MPRRRLAIIPVAVLLAASWVAAPRLAHSCPLCGDRQDSISADVTKVDVAVLIRLVDRPPEQSADAPPEASNCTFEVVEVLKGGPNLARKPGTADPAPIKILYFGTEPLGSQFLALGITPPEIQWGTPTPLSAAAVEYVRRLPKLTHSDTDRLTFCQNYFEHADPLLAGDAYDEFARAPYSDLIAVRDRMPRERLLRWIGDTTVPTHRRRLYLCMLSVCGRSEDLPTLENLILNEDRHLRVTLDAQIGAFLAVKGPAGLPLVENLFLKSADAEYTDTYSTIMGLRFIGTETKAVPRDRLCEALRHILARPQLADLVIPDLARWQDWSALPRLVDLFKTADEQNAWIRPPVINYLRACPLPEAKVRLEELAKIDPEAVVRASQFIPGSSASPAAARRQASE